MIVDANDSFEDDVAISSKTSHSLEERQEIVEALTRISEVFSEIEKTEDFLNTHPTASRKAGYELLAYKTSIEEIGKGNKASCDARVEAGLEAYNTHVTTSRFDRFKGSLAGAGFQAAFWAGAVQIGLTNDLGIPSSLATNMIIGAPVGKIIWETMDWSVFKDDPKKAILKLQEELETPFAKFNEIKRQIEEEDSPEE